MRLYNTLAGKKQEFTPLEDNHVRMYVCGITAYDLCHIGHARSAVVFDVLVRYLRRLGLKVTFVRNFTDVDDKIIGRAAEKNTSCEELSKEYMDAFHRDMDQLNILRPDVEPKATEHIPEMIALTRTLIAKDQAYATASGDVYFRVRGFDGYGKLSRRNIEELRSGARVEPGAEKEDPLDFALWKSAKPGEPAWDSPWGPGRPGWHLECSAMSEKYLGLPFDIHGGGQDLIFPHHENEIAQSEAAAGKDMARFWVHNGFVQVNAEKMSKSLGNFETIQDILNHHHPETVRLFLLTKHYRSPIDFTPENMEEAEKNLKRIYTARQDLRDALSREKWSGAKVPEEIALELASFEDGWQRSMDDDLNTAGALGHVFGAVRLAGRIMEDNAWRKSAQGKELMAKVLHDLETWGGVLGVFTRDADEFLNALREMKLLRKNIDAGDVEKLVSERQQARAARDFEKSDQLRDALSRMGVEVKDTPQGPVWDVV